MIKFIKLSFLLCFLNLMPCIGIAFIQNLPISLVEDFENISKSAYAPENVNGGLGIWYLNDALVGSLESDVKEGHKCLRIRNAGKVSMSFDLMGPSILTTQTAIFGKDDIAYWSVYISYNSGLNYKKLGQRVITASNKLVKNKFYVTNKGKFRIEIRKEPNGKNRFNLENITFIGNGLLNVSNFHSRGFNTQSYGKLSKKKITYIDDNGNMLLGNPDNAKSDPHSYNHYLIDAKYYSISYSRERSEPNWVSWHLALSDLGSSNRQNNFRFDPNLPIGWYVVQPEGYKRSGFDKGHNCPSGDRTSNSTANSITFLMDNIVPQAPNNNQHVWEHLENYCRMQVRKNREAYIICGNYGKGGSGKNGYMESIDNGRVLVPSHLWKIIIILPEGKKDLSRIDSNTRIIAVDIPNRNDVSNNWMNYLCTIKNIETQTGFIFLSLLPEKVALSLKNKIFKGGD